MNLRIMSLAIAGIMALSSTPVYAFDGNRFEGMVLSSNDLALTSTSGVINDGKYTIQNDALHIVNNDESVARKFLDRVSDLTLVNGKMTIKLKFTGKSMMANHKVKINGVETPFKVVNEEGENFHIEFPIASLEDKIVIAAKTMGVRDVEFRVALKKDTIKPEGSVQPPIKPEPPVNPPVKPEPPTQPPVNPEPPVKPGTGSSKYENGLYKIKNKVTAASAMGAESARGALNEISYLEIKGADTYVTLGFGQMDVMNNIRIYINGKNVNYSVVNKGAKTLDIKFKTPSIVSKIEVKAFIIPIEMNISFGVSLIESSLTLVKKDEVIKPLGQGATGGGSSSSQVATGGGSVTSLLGANGSGVGNNSTKPTKYFKRYSVENEILSDSFIGKKMTRKSLDKKAVFEEIDGKFYVSLRLTGSSMMKNIKLKVNSNDTEYEVVGKGSDDLVIKFPVSSINDEIRLYMHITASGRDIDFGVKLLENTKTLIDEGTVGGESSKVDVTSSGFTSEERVDVMQIALITSALTTVFIFTTAGIIYLITRIVKGRKIKKATKKDPSN
ncbi:MAG: NEAT domain-containing protein [Clostridium sp.]